MRIEGSAFAQPVVRLPSEVLLLDLADRPRQCTKAALTLA